MNCIKLMCLLLCCYFNSPPVTAHSFRSLEELLQGIGVNPPLPLFIPNHSIPERNFTYTTWSEYSQCDKECGGGYSSRSRRCVDDQGKGHPVVKCVNVGTIGANLLHTITKYLSGDQYLQEVEKQSCNVENCKTTQWSDWDTCSYPCGGGVQTARRTCINTSDQSRCNFQSIRSRRCGTKPCYRMSDWGRWGQCSVHCGGGQQTRGRTCIPNFNSTDPNYNTLVDVITQVSSSHLYSSTSWLLSTAVLNNFVYWNEYLKTCRAPTTQQTSCNQEQCPSCPGNQVYHHCKPCVRRCEGTQGRSLFTFPSFHELLLNNVPCNGMCESGCGCPSSSPYLGSDNRCYLFQFSCPVNQGQSASEVSRLLTQATTTTASTTVTTTTPITHIIPTEAKPRRNGTAPVQSPSCRYDELIATSPGRVPCVCRGTLTVVQCYTDEETSCPVICQRRP